MFLVGLKYQAYVTFPTFQYSTFAEIPSFPCTSILTLLSLSSLCFAAITFSLVGVPVNYDILIF